MTAIELRRSGLRPLAFDGELLASVDGQWTNGRENNRWHELSVYRTAGGRHVLAVGFRTRWQGESDVDAAFHADDPAAIETALRSVPACPPGIGYPPNVAFADKQTRLESDLRRRLDGLIADLFAQLGPDFAEGIA